MVVRVLRSPQAVPQQQSDVLTELRAWIEVPQDLVEMYLNFDNDAPFNHMRLVYHLCRVLAEIAVGKQVFGSHGATAESAEERDAQVTAAVALQKEAIEWVSAMMRSVMDAAGTVHLIPVDPRTRKVSQLAHQRQGSSSGGGGMSPSFRGPGSPTVQAKQATKQQLDAVRGGPCVLPARLPVHARRDLRCLVE